KPLGDFFLGEVCHWFGTFIHLDSGNDPLLLQRFDKSATFASLLPNRFVKENYTADKFAGTGGGKQNFPIRAAVLLRRRDIDAFHGSGGSYRWFMHDLQRARAKNLSTRVLR